MRDRNTVGAADLQHADDANTQADAGCFPRSPHPRSHCTGATRGAAGQAQSVSKNSSSKTAHEPGVALLSWESSEHPWLLCCSQQQPTATVILLQPHDAASCPCAL